MAEESKKEKQEAENLSNLQVRVDAAVKELNSLLDKHGMTLEVTHNIRVVPKK